MPGRRDISRPPGTGFDRNRFTTRSARRFSLATTFGLPNVMSRPHPRRPCERPCARPCEPPPCRPARASRVHLRRSVLLRARSELLPYGLRALAVQPYELDPSHVDRHRVAARLSGVDERQADGDHPQRIAGGRGNDFEPHEFLGRQRYTAGIPQERRKVDRFVQQRDVVAAGKILAGDGRRGARFRP